MVCVCLRVCARLFVGVCVCPNNQHANTRSVDIASHRVTIHICSSYFIGQTRVSLRTYRTTSTHSHTHSSTYTPAVTVENRPVGHAAASVQVRMRLASVVPCTGHLHFAGALRCASIAISVPIRLRSMGHLHGPNKNKNKNRLPMVSALVAHTFIATERTLLARFACLCRCDLRLPNDTHQLSMRPDSPNGLSPLVNRK